ncbi:hypothetical protein DFA_10810 [Cavenderia fasciculata]|uniref:Uncharacterized protein n=1 Tax=Cavenderia fasciculata TaxID=261658 RepID=F4QBG4_CACFS|nr:uncharacterized protein DFA_10810 [Cavenderia fasciculata]EGG14936.1 hypothetical protein DFA_10810 [Cavenderia fasciculata]|eukprot:XP_004351452.1 hypothetical protein DFA_10810 [Cavenderia fasciculata]
MRFSQPLLRQTLSTQSTCTFTATMKPSTTTSTSSSNSLPSLASPSSTSNSMSTVSNSNSNNLIKNSRIFGNSLIFLHTAISSDDGGFLITIRDDYY